MSNVTINEKELAALRLAAKFITDHEDMISFYNQFAIEIAKIHTPNATARAFMDVRETELKINRDLEAVLDSLGEAGLLD
ncbi:hypothetical protein [Streptomyces violaceorubidus]|uniref:hypothetical protein n=1 Tax=Streptomyces violaceorubidus TaxID=284042 RepID=UPI0004C28634|nr:hypothetical protein [Streptomyces violaceorubidus]